MSSEGMTLRVRAATASARPAELPHAILSAALTRCDLGFDSPSVRALLGEYAMEHVSAELTGDALTIWLANPGGMLGASSEILGHWLAIALPLVAEAAAAEHGFAITAIAGPSLTRTLIAGPTYPLLWHRDRYWCVARQVPGDPAKAEVFGDGTLLDLRDLTPTESAALDLARYSGRCTCGICDFAIEAQCSPAVAGMTTVSEPGAREAAWRHAASDPSTARAAGAAIHDWDAPEWLHEPEGPQALVAFVTEVERATGKAFATLDAAALALAMVHQVP